MTVKELRAALEKLPDDMVFVVTVHEASEEAREIDGVDIEERELIDAEDGPPRRKVLTGYYSQHSDMYQLIDYP